MQMFRQVIAAGVVGCLIGCGSDGSSLEPGALVITLTGTTPAGTNAATLQVAGQVARTPEAEVAIVVSATGGPTAVSDTAGADGSFALALPLNANVQNSFSLTATDASGSTSGVPLTVEIRHDNQPPQVSSLTPAAGSDGVTPATIQVVYNEPVVPGSPNVLVTQYGVSVPGTVALSADSLTLTFTPNAPFAGNAVILVNVTSSRDALNNILNAGGGCFVTGGPGIDVFADTGQLFVAGTPPTSLVPPDLQQIRLGRTATTLLGVMQFSTPRTLDPSADNNTSVWIDLDVDQDGGTGFVPFKDFAFAGLLPSSGTASEFFIEMGTLLDVVDLAVAAQYVSQDTAQGEITFTGITALAPTACGTLLGFAVPFTVLGSDDGAFDATIYVDAFGGTGLIADAAPDEGLYSASVTGAVPDLGAAVSTRVRRASMRGRRPWAIRHR